jgi:asparagine synthase (glutamine-hydrolysing)
VPDSTLIASAYATYGDSIFPQMIGEFAACLWCEQTNSLLLVRSLSGARTLYYASHSGRLMWSTDFAHLVRASGVSLQINSSYVLEYLISQPSAEHSPLENIQVVPPNTLLRFDRCQQRKRFQLWDANRVQPLHYRRDEEYEEECRDRVKSAVAVRLRATPPIFAELSGGLDSSTVVLSAQQILQERNEDPGHLKTLSCTFEESSTCDELRFIQAVEERRGRPSVYVPERDQQTTLGLRDITFKGVPTPLDCFPGRHRRFAKTMRQHGARVLLTGVGGDNLFWSYSEGAPVIADCLRLGNILQAHKRCYAWSQATGIPYLQLLLQRSLPLLLGIHAHKRSQYMLPAIPSWIAQRYKRVIPSLVSDFYHRDTTHGLPSQQAQRRLVHSFFATLSAGYFSHCHDIYITHPYNHQPLVEFCLSLPISQLIRDGETRSIMRRAFRAILPPKIVKRKTKPGPEETFLRALQREWSDIGDLRKWQLCERGFVEPDALSESFHKNRMGLQLPNEVLIRVFSLERWLRSLNHVGDMATGDNHNVQTVSMRAHIA